MNNSDLKNSAKSILKNTYWISFAASLIYGILVGVANSISNWISNIGSSPVNQDKLQRLIERGDIEGAIQLAASQGSNPVFSLIGNIVSIVISIFLVNVLLVGLNKFYLNARNGNTDIGALFKPFSSYGGTVKTMFFHSLYIGLWSLLFVIPGIVKSYSYYMVPYIVAENPGIDTARAFEISKKTMDGEKGKAFYMHLSFIGWYLLGFIACCIGILFVNPYAQATYTEFYNYVKQKALSTGIATPEDFGMIASSPVI
ncbi:MAG: DUF975 family protein [Clostridiales bacterium]|nr:DUF975 family protein [Clostridiales bacterium]